MFVKKKNQIPDMDELITGQIYSLTINPTDRIQYFHETNRFIKCVKDIIEKVLLYQCLDYQLYIEISKKGRIHFHGCIRVKDKFMFYLYAVYLQPEQTDALVGMFQTRRCKWQYV